MKYSDSHEWVKVNGTTGQVGISTHAQKELGEIVYVELPKVGQEVKAGDEVAVLESTKAAADIYTPVTGIITQVNQAAADTPSLLNTSPEREGYLFEIALSAPEELEALMPIEAYTAMVGS
ncbi:glycine cleavage system protein GcvH [Candidatus Neptunochlamydia vexilliferae]|nr:glycine cleavage system protein GcvH [Candidatus Neptunochlamydia vexilliferae]